MSKLGWPDPRSDETLERKEESSDETSDSGSWMMGADGAADAVEAGSEAPKKDAADEAVEPDDDLDEEDEADEDEGGKWAS